MPKIHQLPPSLISQIAAGEVIERPAFAIKEVIENALDAKATDITIYIEDAGLRKIQITDNGEGMEAEDILKSWKLHTTSKLSEKDTLVGIKSFGFRGEALASLAAVSKLTIKSRIPTNPVGFEIIVQNNRLATSHPVGMPEGTVVISENLFAHVPARKKFLKSHQTELRHILDTVTHFAVSQPTVRFRLIHNKRVLLDTPPTQNHKGRLQLLLGEDFALFLPIKKEESYIKLSGFIAKPQLTSFSQSKQFLFVNNRKVQDKLISLAIKEAFGTMLEPTKYPLFVLFVNVPFEMVDVNIHPRKEQVSFVNNQYIFTTIKQAITDVLQENNITFQNLSWLRNGVGTTNSFAGRLLRQEVLEKEKFTPDFTQTFLQLDKLYIIVPTKKGLFLIDQHAAHERILFEKLSEEFIKQKNKQKKFKLPKTLQIQLSFSEQLLLKENKRLFEKLGFIFKQSTQTSEITMKQFNNKAIVLTHIPILFQDRNMQQLIQEIIEELQTEKPIKDIDSVTFEMLAFLACRAAVKAGDNLSEKQMKEIVEKLETSPNNITCPHGRPTRILITKEEIDNLFKR